MQCRVGCGACCIAISISSPLPGLPHGKPAGMRCPHLSPEFTCTIWGHPDYPTVCARFPAQVSHCGQNRGEALTLLAELERLTTPDVSPSPA